MSPISESLSSSDLSQSTIERSSAESFSQATQTYCCFEEEKRNDLNDRREKLQQKGIFKI